MLSDVAFGQYYPTESPVHRMDPRAKINFLIAYIVMIFIVKNFWGFLISGIFLSLAVAVSKVPLGSVLKSMKAILFLILFTFVLNVFFYESDENAVKLFWVVTDEGIYNAVFLALRLILLVMGSSVLTLTTTPVNLTDGIESLLKPLKLIHFPVHELALIMSIALRFIPTLMDETERIIRAQKARGADFESGNLISRAKALVPILIPLLISAFRRAEELGDAMDARCYSGSSGRTKFKKLKFGYRDLIGLLIVAVSVTAVVLLNIYGINPIINLFK